LCSAWRRGSPWFPIAIWSVGFPSNLAQTLASTLAQTWGSNLAQTVASKLAQTLGCYRRNKYFAKILV